MYHYPIELPPFLFFFAHAVYTGSGDALARCFDGKSGSLRRTFTGHGVAVTSLQVGQETGMWVLGYIRLWTIDRKLRETKQIPRPLKNEYISVISRFHPIESVNFSK